MEHSNQSMTDFRCQSCASTHARMVIDLGNQPLANNLLTHADVGKPEPKFPLRVAVCQTCWLMQITDLVPPVALFSDYLYFSSFSDALLRHARAAAESYVAEFALDQTKRVVEIASNDGYLLQNFVRLGIPCIGIEPAANIAEVARAKGIETVVEFFGVPLARRMAAEGRQADLILGNNVFAHAPDTNDFVAGLALLLRPGGRIILEFPYGVDFIEHTEFDTIYHEHVFYFTLAALMSLFARHGLEIFRVARLSIHGGSLRLFAAYSGDYPIDASVGALQAEELKLGVSTEDYYRNFSEGVQRIRQDLLTLLATLKAQGKSIAAYGASAKGSTLLNFIQPPEGTIEFIADRSTYKQGRLSPGLHIPILPAEALKDRRPDYTLLLTWNFATEIQEQQKEYREQGGKFIVPIPEVAVL